MFNSVVGSVSYCDICNFEERLVFEKRMHVILSSSKWNDNLLSLNCSTFCRTFPFLDAFV